MITPETFYKQVHDNFVKVFDKMDDLHKETRDDMEKLSVKIGETDEKLNTHLKVEEELDKYKKEEAEKLEKEKTHSSTRNHFITGTIVVAGLGIWAVLQSFFA